MTSKNENTRKTSLLLPEELHWSVKELAVKRRISDTKAMHEALTLWCAIGAYPEAAALAEILQDTTKRGKTYRLKLLPILRDYSNGE